MKNQGADNELQKKWMQLVARAWADDALKRRLVADPVPLLREHGIEVPAGTEVHVVEPSDRLLYLLLPPAPTRGAELTSNELASITGGETYMVYTMKDAYISSGGSGTTTSSSCWSCAMF